MIANESFPSIIVDLPNSWDKITFEGLKFAHICEQINTTYKAPDHAKLKEKSYRHFRVQDNMNTNILIKKGVVNLDDCRLSLATQKDSTKLSPSIVVEK